MEPHKRRRRIVLSVVLPVFILIVAIMLYDSNTRLVLTEYELRYRDLPARFDGFRIVALSDIHAAEFGEDNERLISMVRDAEPDIIAITGDLIDGYGKPPVESQLEIADRLAAGLMEIAPVYYVTGNHDWNSGAVKTLINIL